MTLTRAAIAFALVLALVYAVSCAVWPFARCQVCDGTGRHARKDGKVWRACRWCRGTGRRLRIGRWLWNAARQRRREGTR